MSAISKIIVKEWFKSFAGSLLSLIILISTADLINGFLRGKNFSAVFLEYILKMPDLGSKILPVSCLLATLFAFNRLKQQSELIAMFAAGYSYFSIYRLILFCSLVIVACQFLNLSYLEPMANKKKRDTIAKSRVSEGKYLTKSSVSDGVFWFRSENYFATFSFFDKESKSLINPQIYYVAPNSLLSDVYQVKRARFLKDQEWQLEEGIHLHQLDNEGFPKTETIQQTAIKLRETPSDFYEFESDLTTLDFFQLKQFLDKMSKTGMNIREYQVLLMKKLALAMVCGIFALIPLSTIFNPNRRSASFGKNVAFALVFTIIFWVLFSFTLSFGEKGTWTPLLSAFVLPLGCLLFILWGFIQHRKLSF